MFVAMIFVIVVLLPALIALATAVAAILLKDHMNRAGASRLTVAVVGTIGPLALAVDGLRLAWPWPWFQPESMHDGIPAGPVMLMAAGPSWPACLAVSWLMLRSRKGGRR